jgi:hypothetical protein
LLAVGTKEPERKVENNVIVSQRDPSTRTELPESVQYVGANRWVLFQIADCSPLRRPPGCQRLARLLHEARRKLLMIIYGEDLGPIFLQKFVSECRNKACLHVIVAEP